MLEAIKAEQRSWKNTDWFSPNVDCWLTNVCLEVGVFEYFSCENDLTCWLIWNFFCTTTTLLQYWQKTELLFKVLKTSPDLLYGSIHFLSQGNFRLWHFGIVK